MGNKSYQKGYRKEREIVNQARKEGFIALSSRGSHSPIDVVIVCPKQKIVKFIQVKNFKVYGKKLKELEKFKDLSDEYMCKFEVWSL
jgi:Holliday junction resolvase